MTTNTTAPLTDMFNLTSENFLGKTVRDRVTGVRGIATSLHIVHGRMDTYMIVPPSEDGVKIPEPIMADSNYLEVIDAGLSDLVADEFARPEVAIGDACVDIFSGFSGLVADYLVSMNGCIEVGVQPLVDEDNNGNYRKKLYIPSNRAASIRQIKATTDERETKAVEDLVGAGAAQEGSGRGFDYQMAAADGGRGQMAQSSDGEPTGGEPLDPDSPAAGDQPPAEPRKLNETAPGTQRPGASARRRASFDRV